MEIKNLLYKVITGICLTIGLNGFAQVPIANFSMNPSPVCAGVPVIVTDLSTNAPTTWSYTFTGGAPATSAVKNPTVTFAAAGVHTITLIATNGNGASIPVSKTITVNANPGAFITVNPQTMCVGGNPLTYTANTFGPGGPFTFSWTTGATTNTISVSPPVTTVYTCVITSTAGCSVARTCTANVNPLPTVTITANPTSICAGGTSTLTASASGAGPFTYTWSTAATTSSITTNLPAVYSVTVTNGTGCKGTQSYTLGVAATLSLTATSNPTALCNGNTATLTVIGAVTYTWSTGGLTPTIAVTPTTTTTYTVIGKSGVCTGTTSIILAVNPNPTVTATSSPTSICRTTSGTLSAIGATTYTWNPGALAGATVVVSPTLTTTYSVTGTTGNCTNTKTVTMVVIPNPTPTANANPAFVCTGNNSTLTSTGALTYTWSTGTTASVTVVTPTINSTYTVTGTNAAGCTGTRTVGVFVSSPTVTAVASSGTICSGQSSTLTAGGAITYTWNTGPTTITIAVSPTITTNYTVTGSNATGCTNSKTISIIVNAVPTVTATSTSTGVCIGNSATLSAIGAVSYTWNPGAIVGANATVSPVLATTYTVIGTNACGANTKTISVAVNANPTVTAASSSTLLCAGQTVTLTTSGASTYTWNPGGLTGASVTDTPTITTTYTVTGTSANGCTNATTFVQNVSICAGIQNINSDNTVRVYPNPNNGIFNVQVNIVNDNSEFVIYNLLGQKVFGQMLTNGNNTMATKGMAKGLYQFVILQNKTIVNKGQLIIE